MHIRRPKWCAYSSDKLGKQKCASTWIWMCTCVRIYARKSSPTSFHRSMNQRVADDNSTYCCFSCLSDRVPPFMLSYTYVHTYVPILFLTLDSANFTPSNLIGAKCKQKQISTSQRLQCASRQITRKRLVHEHQFGPMILCGTV